MKVIASALLLCFAANYSAQASDLATLNVNDYNLICVSHGPQRGQVYFNTYSLSVGLRLNTDGGFLNDLETLLVQPVYGCDNCYDVTAATRFSHDHIYFVKIRTSACSHLSSCRSDDAITYTVSLFETVGDTQIEDLLFEHTRCIPNKPAATLLF